MKAKTQSLHQGAKEKRTRGLESALDVFRENHHFSWLRIGNYLLAGGAPFALIPRRKKAASGQRFQKYLIDP